LYGSTKSQKSSRKEISQVNEVIELIEQKILDIKNYPISTQEEEQMHILEIGCLNQLLRVANELS
jgi:hypothetical protein